jgi:hypothetical protein
MFEWFSHVYNDERAFLNAHDDSYNPEVVNSDGRLFN